MADLRTFTKDDVAKHNTEEDLYITIHGAVYDVTKYVKDHPGGEEVMMSCAGSDGTEGFDDIGHSDDAKKTLETLKVGSVEGAQQVGPPTSQVTSKEDPSTKRDMRAVLLGFGHLMVILTSLFFILVIIGLFTKPECKHSRVSDHMIKSGLLSDAESLLMGG